MLTLGSQKPKPSALTLCNPDPLPSPEHGRVLTTMTTNEGGAGVNASADLLHRLTAIIGVLEAERARQTVIESYAWRQIAGELLSLSAFARVQGDIRRTGFPFEPEDPGPDSMSPDKEPGPEPDPGTDFNPVTVI